MICTGPIDEYFDYRFGPLPYRSLEFKFETLDIPQAQPVAVVNYPNDQLYTRVTEFKFLTGQVHPKTTRVYEYPQAEGDPYYPIPGPENAALYRKYQELGEATAGVHFVGRLGTYKYYNMDQVVAQALTTVRQDRRRPPQRRRHGMTTSGRRSPRALGRHRMHDQPPRRPLHRSARAGRRLFADRPGREDGGGGVQQGPVAGACGSTRRRTGCGQADWRWCDATLPLLRDHGIEPIIGLVHHGSGPASTDLLDEQFGDKLAEYAAAFARRYPWVRLYTPINEPLTTARFSALYGHWYPHRRDDAAFVAALINQTRATIKAMAAVRDGHAGRRARLHRGRRVDPRHRRGGRAGERSKTSGGG